MNVLPLQKVLNIIEKSQHESITIAQLAKQVYFSESHLQLLFRQISGQSIKSYVCGRKLAHSLGDLYETDVIYMPSVKIKEDAILPEGLEKFSFPVHQCVRFRYIGQQPIEEINIMVASETYDLIEHFFQSQQRYVRNKNYHYERIDGNLYDGVYSQMVLWKKSVFLLHS